MKKIFILLPLLLMAASCNNQSQVSQLQQQVQSLQASQGASSSINFQAQCAAQAQVAMNSFQQGFSGDSDFTSFSQTNHYNQQLNQCFALIDYSPNFLAAAYKGEDSSDQQTGYEDLLNAYENTDLAACIFYQNKPPYDSSNDLCSIGDKEATYQQYEDFVNQRMELVK